MRAMICGIYLLLIIDVTIPFLSFFWIFPFSFWWIGWVGVCGGKGRSGGGGGFLIFLI